MIYDSCLLITAFLYAWIAGDLLFSHGPRRFLGLGAAALSVSVWSVGELFVQRATTPDGLMEARRLLYLGVCTLGPAWLVGVSQAVRAPWFVRRPWLAMYIAAPGMLAYTSLHLDSAFFLDPAAPALEAGPFFWWHGLVSGSLVLAGFAIVARHLEMLGARWPMRATLAVAAFLPLLAQALYRTAGWPAWDPTPVALGGLALLVRFRLLDPVLTPDVVAVARREVLEQSEAGFLAADAFGRIVGSNPAARHLTGLQGLHGAPIDDVLELAIHNPLRSISVERSVLDRSGLAFGTAVLLEDRTGVRAAEQRLELATRFEALGFLISGVTHQISNPLSYVRGNLGLIERLIEAVRQDPEWVERLPPSTRRIAREGDSIIRDTIAGADRITLLARQLGTFARDEARRPAALADLSMIAHQAAELAGLGRAPERIRISHEDALPLVFTREQDVLQILLHLLINAVQAGTKDGVIEIELHLADGYVTVGVLDRGPGIAPELLPHVFDPFFTTKDGAVNQGLGLSLSYALARQNGGVIEASPREGGGAAFVLLLPIDPRTAEERAADGDD